MGKVFTITEGLENMGALKTGGQGSVYKARRNGTTITAVKLLPTPIYSESGEDKNFTDFQNEVQKLRKVNQEANPHVVTILSSGITDTGSFPYIEMEFIEGADLQELLQPPNDPVFTIDNVIRVADHISDAMAHCHQVGVKHGDIKTNNIKLNSVTGNYVLLDFGLALMSDEQRRTSLRHAGAIEFMAPEQNEGRLLFETDVYSFGIILYELLAGQVPFPLLEKGETSRNHVMVSHMETAPPDLMTLREQNLPIKWPAEKKETELGVPGWLLDLIEKCLHKEPSLRFENGMALHAYIKENMTKAPIVPPLQDKIIIRAPFDDTKVPLPTTPVEHKAVPTISAEEDRKAVIEKSPVKRKSLSPVLLIVLLVGTGLLAFAAYSFLGKTHTATQKVAETVPSVPLDSPAINAAPTTEVPIKKQEKTKPKEVDSAVIKQVESGDPPQVIAADQVVIADSSKANEESASETKKEPGGFGTYTVRSKAFFHNEPDESTRRAAFINHWNKAVLKPLDEKNGFVYIVYTNDEGKTSKGWMRKADLIRIDE
ncbi:MAG: hypothetical protein JWP88_628 [Flaviaesturariibacter sp.]|nr:hypothetical protein [Flaviaesturariibacter sp.]